MRHILVYSLARDTRVMVTASIYICNIQHTVIQCITWQLRVHYVTEFLVCVMCVLARARAKRTLKYFAGSDRDRISGKN